MDFYKQKERKARSEEYKIHQALIGEGRRRITANRKWFPRHFQNFHFLRLHWRPLKVENRDLQFSEAFGMREMLIFPGDD